MTPDDRPTEDVLRRVLDARAQRVQFAPDALGSIRSRIDRRTRQRRRRTMSIASAAAGALATVTAVVVGVASCVPPQPQPTPPPGASTTTDPGPTTPPATPDTGLPVYYLGEANNRVVLYREFHHGAGDTLPAWISAAVTDMLTVRPGDPNYRTGWPASAGVRGVTLDGDVAIVDLSGAALNSVGAETAEMAVQQLVWTVTAASAIKGTQLQGIRLRLDGQDVSELWGHVAVGGVLRRGPALQVQAPVWLISPQQGDEVGGTFRVHIDGAVPEATVQLRVRNTGGATVNQQFVTLSQGAPGRGEAFVELTLPPGSYTLEAYFESLQDGSEQGLDDHAITVR
jgi:hypothetical protein